MFYESFLNESYNCWIPHIIIIFAPNYFDFLHAHTSTTLLLLHTIYWNTKELNWNSLNEAYYYYHTKKKILFEFSFPKQNSFVILLLSILPNIPSLLFSDGTGIRSQIFGNISSIFAIFLMIFRSCITMILAKNEENPWSTCLLLKTHFPWVLETRNIYISRGHM